MTSSVVPPSSCFFCEGACSDDEPSLTLSSFRMLMRYLKVEVFELCHQFGVDKLGSTCDKCGEILNEFWSLYRDFEGARLMLDNCVRKVKTVMKESSRAHEDGNLLKMIIKLETAKKCSLKLTSKPRVDLGLITKQGHPLRENYTQTIIHEEEEMSMDEGYEIKIHAIEDSADVFVYTTEVEDDDDPSETISEQYISSENFIPDLKLSSGNKLNLNQELEKDNEETMISSKANGIPTFSIPINISPSVPNKSEEYNDNLTSQNDNPFPPPAIVRMTTEKRRRSSRIKSVTQKSKLKKYKLNQERESIIANEDDNEEMISLEGNGISSYSSLIEAIPIPKKDDDNLTSPTDNPSSPPPVISLKTREQKHRTKSKSVTQHETTMLLRKTALILPSKSDVKCKDFKPYHKSKKDVKLRSHKNMKRTLVKDFKRPLRVCPYCNGLYSYHGLDNHLVDKHAKDHFAHRLPPGTTEDKLEKAVNILMLKEKGRIFWENGRKKYKCPFLCSNYSGGSATHLRNHIFRHHIEKVADKLNNLTSSSGQEDLEDAIHFVTPRRKKNICRSTKATSTISAIMLKKNSSDFSETPGKEAEACPHCGIFTKSSCYHQIQKHAKEYFVEKLPPETTEDELEEAVKSVLHEMRKAVVDKDGKRQYECPLCFVKVTSFPSGMRVHVLTKHFGKVLKKLKQLRNVSANDLQLSTEPGCSGGTISQKVTRPKETPLNPVGLPKCIYCEELFPTEFICQRHTKTQHPFHCFRDKFPSGTTERGLEKAIGEMTAKYKQLPEDSTEFGCAICSTSVSKNSLRQHIILRHFDKVTATLAGQATTTIVYEEEAVDEKVFVVVEEFAK